MALGWPLGHAWATQGPPKPKPKPKPKGSGFNREILNPGKPVSLLAKG
jgi:hypothetical protein